MRSFEQRKEEIFRRSRVRILRRKRLLAACIPLAVCAGLGAAFLAGRPSVGMPAETVASEVITMGVWVPEETAPSQTAAISVAVYREDRLCTEAEGDAAERAAEILNGITAKPLKTSGQSTVSPALGAGKEAPAYRIVVREDQTTRTFLLGESTLGLPESETVYSLTQAEREALLQALNLPVPKAP